AAWEDGMGEGPARRALALLAAAHPGTARQELAALPLGERDRRLLDLHREVFGPRLDGVARCPECGEPLEIALDARRLHTVASAVDRAFVRGDLELRFRLPDSRDLVAAETCGGVAEARRLLPERCVVAAHRDGAPVAAATLGEGEIVALAAALEAADPGAELLLALACPVCACAWSEGLDVAAFVWSEVAVEVRRLLGEVHQLARAYG